MEDDRNIYENEQNGIVEGSDEEEEDGEDILENME